MEFVSFLIQYKNEILDKDNHIAGRLTKEMIPEIDASSAFYICNPNDYIKNIRGHLKELAVSENKTFFEYFVKI
jgi:ferredoxin-NADP reductase